MRLRSGVRRLYLQLNPKKHDPIRISSVLSPLFARYFSYVTADEDLGPSSMVGTLILSCSVTKLVSGLLYFWRVSGLLYFWSQVNFFDMTSVQPYCLEYRSFMDKIILTDYVLRIAVDIISVESFLTYFFPRVLNHSPKS